MKWNWQLSRWPSFSYDPSAIALLEERFAVEGLPYRMQGWV